MITIALLLLLRYDGYACIIIIRLPLCHQPPRTPRWMRTTISYYDIAHNHHNRERRRSKVARAPDHTETAAATVTQARHWPSSPPSTSNPSASDRETRRRWPPRRAPLCQPRRLPERSLVGARGGHGTRSLSSTVGTSILTCSNQVREVPISQNRISHSPLLRHQVLLSPSVGETVPTGQYPGMGRYVLRCTWYSRPHAGGPHYCVPYGELRAKYQK